MEMPSLPKWSAWSSDPKDMELGTYFSDDPGIPSVSKAFRIPHLQALMVNVDPDVGDEYLLTDNRGRFYLWNSLTMMIWRFKNQMTPAEVVTMVSQDTYEEKWLTRDLNNGSTADLPSPAPPTNLMYEDGS